jgi:hypothetical protein
LAIASLTASTMSLIFVASSVKYRRNQSENSRRIRAALSGSATASTRANCELLQSVPEDDISGCWLPRLRLG